MGYVSSVASSSRARGFAFVEMTNEADEQTAVHRFDEQPLGGRSRTVNLAKPQVVRTGGDGSGRRHSTTRW